MWLSLQAAITVQKGVVPIRMAAVLTGARCGCSCRPRLQKGVVPIRMAANGSTRQPPPSWRAHDEPHERVSGATHCTPEAPLVFTVVSPCSPLALPLCQDAPQVLPGNTKPARPRVKSCRGGWHCETALACPTTARYTVGRWCSWQVPSPQELRLSTGSFFVASHSSLLWRDFGQPTGDLALLSGSKTSSAVRAGRAGADADVDGSHGEC